MKYVRDKNGGLRRATPMKRRTMAAVAAAVPRISTDGEALAVTVVTLGVARATVAPTFGRAASPRGRGVTVIGESPSIQAVHHFGACLKARVSGGG